MIRILAPMMAATLASAAGAQQAPAAEEAKPVTKTELVAELDSDFADLDSDGDGKAGREEIVARLDRTAKAQLAELGKQRDAAFARFDADGNGTISRAEFDAQAKLPALPTADAKPFLDQFDANKDGVIAKDEFRAPTLANFDRMDGNKDGTLSLAEQQGAAKARTKPQSTPPIGR